MVKPNRTNKTIHGKQKSNRNPQTSGDDIWWRKKVCHCTESNLIREIGKN
jgi:hypothetical protein